MEPGYEYLLPTGTAGVAEKQGGFFLIKIVFVLLFTCAHMWSLYAFVFVCGGQKLTPEFFSVTLSPYL